MKIFILLLSLVLTGCSGIKTVEIPIPLPAPKQHLPPKPELPIYKLKKGDSPSVVAKAAMASIYIQQQWINAVAE